MDSQINSFDDINKRLFEIFKKDDFSFGIGDIANYSKIPQSKLRYWEKCGYIDSQACSKNQNRKYTYRTLMKVQIIKSYLDSGFTLNAAADKAEEFSHYQSVIHRMIKSRISNIGMVDGKPAVDMGPLSNDPNKSIYFIEDEDQIKAIIK